MPAPCVLLASLDGIDQAANRIALMPSAASAFGRCARPGLRPRPGERTGDSPLHPRRSEHLALSVRHLRASFVGDNAGGLLSCQQNAGSAG